LINPDLDRTQLAESFSRDGKVRISDVLRADFAESMFQCMSNDVPWGLMYWKPDVQGPASVGRLSSKQRAAMSDADTRALIDKVNSQAKTQFQYLYEAYDVLDAYRKGLNPTLLLHEFLGFMGSDETFQLVRDITGDDVFNRVDCHACRYLPGHFLKEHVDSSPFEHRQMAYVFNFTRDWHPDFGGLTYFLDDDGKVTDTFVPDFNSLTLFKVPVAHCVSQVTSFAPHPRNSVTGWFTRYD
jgi:SM-20-related protein